jgi:magnesium-transporting ATPase (P-type)
VRTLTESDIDTKIITGDNIFLGVQTALSTGMISAGAKVVVLEGAKFQGESVEATELQRLPSGEITESQRMINNFSFDNEEDIAYAIDNDFINNNPESFLHGRVKVFARISPENKALIVRRHREMIAAKMKARPFWKRIFGECSVKVGMVGDGANDLIAIKDADLGIGISSSDAVYSAAFAIKDLSQIVDILC